MSPLPLRRYRAERLLRREFAARRTEVLGSVRARLRAQGVRLDDGDVEACYAQAWQGLYATLLEGREISNPTAWLTVVTQRRALDEHRERRRAIAATAIDTPRELVVERDLSLELDDGVRLRQLFEGLRTRLSARECEAASLCYLQGLSRAEAAARLGIDERAMRKLMDGRGPGRPGVAVKFGELLRAVDGGAWCEQQASLMRALAFGVLDPDGERYRVARLHQRECPACRAYVLSLRGLASVLPPLALPWSLASVGAGVGASAASSGAGTGAATGAGAGAGVGGSAGIGFGAAKLATGCLLVLGAGCVALTTLPRHSPAVGEATARTPAATVQRDSVRSSTPTALASSARGTTAFDAARRRAASAARRRSSATDARRAVRRHDFAGRDSAARLASAQREFGIESAARAAARPASRSTNTTAGASAAEREFGP